MRAALPADEDARLEALRELEILDWERPARLGKGVRTEEKSNAAT